MPIYDDTHAVNAASVCVVMKAESVQPPPFESAWYLVVQTTAGTQTLRFDDEGKRDGFYKELINAMP